MGRVPEVHGGGEDEGGRERREEEGEGGIGREVREERGGKVREGERKVWKGGEGGREEGR